MAQRRSIARRHEIRAAALACFSELGFDGTTIEAIRRRSQASTGSIYHHYGSKEQLAAAVYVEGIGDYQTRVLAALESSPGAEAGLRAIVRAHMQWVEEHPDWARFLFDMRRVPCVAASESAIRELDEGFMGGLGRWFRRHVDTGRLRKLPSDLYSSVIMGPCMDFTRRWLDGDARTEIRAAAETLGDCVWHAAREPRTATREEE